MRRDAVGANAQPPLAGRMRVVRQNLAILDEDGAAVHFESYPGVRRMRGPLRVRAGSLLPSTLERAGFVRIAKGFVGRTPRTRVGITAPGRRAFQNHLACLRDILDGDSADP